MQNMAFSAVQGSEAPVELFDKIFGERCVLWAWKVMKNPVKGMVFGLELGAT
tara:strand:+ start:581 stop:736 length:156 start_codon:yes stop_codon:yes gene_type:complete